MLLPKKLTKDSHINLVYTSSPVGKSDIANFKRMFDRLKKDYPLAKIFDVQRKQLDPRYLAASENERLKMFKYALRDANWILPIYGGTGCADIVRYLSPENLLRIKRNRPIVNGFSDATFLLNYLYFKLKLVTFHYANGCSLIYNNNYKLFLDVITGKVDKLDFYEKSYQWISTAGAPKEKIEGIAIGGNISTFRDLLDICEIKPRALDDYILFIEDIGIDMEDLHRIIISLDEKGFFMNVKALVIGRFNERSFKSSFLKLNSIFGRKKELENIFEYLISDVIEERLEDKDPLYMLEADNFGHGVDKNPMIIPIGAKTIIHPNGKIEFIGPFVE